MVGSVTLDRISNAEVESALQLARTTRWIRRGADSDTAADSRSADGSNQQVSADVANNQTGVSGQGHSVTTVGAANINITHLC